MKPPDPELDAARTRLERAYEAFVREQDRLMNVGEHRQARERVAMLRTQLLLAAIRRFGV